MSHSLDESSVLLMPYICLGYYYLLIINNRRCFITVTEVALAKLIEVEVDYRKHTSHPIYFPFRHSIQVCLGVWRFPLKVIRASRPGTAHELRPGSANSCPGTTPNYLQAPGKRRVMVINRGYPEIWRLMRGSIEAVNDHVWCKWSRILYNILRKYTYSSF